MAIRTLKGILMHECDMCEYRGFSPMDFRSPCSNCQDMFDTEDSEEMEP
ncbi:MAG TPA: hypothetical protein HA257_05480 [Candidatus Methanoperedenaceae archaeon]|nr:hypothetical protein [Candidatus Methanoperedenaceae archaeon]